MWGVLSELLKALIPPQDNADPRSIYQHRLVISLWLVGLTMGGIVHIALVCGFLTMFFPGFVKADSYEDLQRTIQRTQQDIKQLRADDVGTAIFDMRERQCKTPANKGAYTLEMVRLMDIYFKLSGHTYNLRDCTEY